MDLVIEIPGSVVGMYRMSPSLRGGINSEPSFCKGMIVIITTKTAIRMIPTFILKTSIMLKPEDQWRPGMTVKKLIDEMNAAIQFPGVTNAWTMPIKTRIDMLSTGIKTPVGIKLAGDDLNTLQKLGEQIESVVSRIPGTLSVFSERVVGGNYFDFEIDRKEAARPIFPNT